MKHVPGLGLIATSIRTLAPVRLYRPHSCEQAVHILHNEEAPPAVLAGGTDLCAKFNDGFAPRSLVALDRVDALRRIERVGSEIRIGSGVTHAAGLDDPLLKRQLRGFAHAWGAIANARVRFRATIGGNIMALYPRYEMSVILDALDAALAFRVVDRTVRLTPAEVWNGKVPPRALLEYIAIPVDDDFLAFRYDRSLRPTMTLAVCLRGTDNAFKPRGAIATELRRPTPLHFPVVASRRDLTSKEFAAAAAARLPADYADANTTNWYLRRATAALLQRNMEDVARV